MWFKIKFFADKPFVLAMVGKDRQIYFKASDVGRFIGYSNPTIFGNRYGKKKSEHLMPFDIAQQHRENRVHVFSYDEMISAIATRRPNNRPGKEKNNNNDDDDISDRRRRRGMTRPVFPQRRLEEMRDLWKDGFVFRTNFKCAIHPNLAPKLVLDGRDGDMRIVEWLQIYKESVMGFFDWIERKQPSVVSPNPPQQHLPAPPLSPVVSSSIPPQQPRQREQEQQTNPLEFSIESILYSDQPPPPNFSINVEGVVYDFIRRDMANAE